MEREQLFEGSSDDDAAHTPRKRSTQEILTKYKFKGVAFLLLSFFLSFCISLAANTLIFRNRAHLCDDDDLHTIAGRRGCRGSREAEAHGAAGETRGRLDRHIDPPVHA